MQQMDKRKIPQRTGEVFSYFVTEVRRDRLLVLMPKCMQMWHLGIWFSAELGSVEFMVRLNALIGIFKPK